MITLNWALLQKDKKAKKFHCCCCCCVIKWRRRTIQHTTKWSHFIPSQWPIVQMQVATTNDAARQHFNEPKDQVSFYFFYFFGKRRRFSYPLKMHLVKVIYIKNLKLYAAPFKIPLDRFRLWIKAKKKHKNVGLCRVIFTLRNLIRMIEAD